MGEASSIGAGGHAQSDSWRIIDEDWGSYVSVTKVWDEEGRTKFDIGPTLKLVEKAMKMGPPWTRWNNLTERWDIFYVRKTHREHFSRAWTIYKTWQDGDEKATPSIATETTKEQTPGKAMEKTKEKNTTGQPLVRGKGDEQADQIPEACANKF